MNRAEETQLIKNCLKTFGYRIKVTHGKGTSWGRIKIYIPRNKWSQDHHIIEAAVASTTGRSNLENNRISVNWYE
jgi:hypothetical protein